MNDLLKKLRSMHGISGLLAKEVTSIEIDGDVLTMMLPANHEPLISDLVTVKLCKAARAELGNSSINVRFILTGEA